MNASFLISRPTLTKASGLHDNLRPALFKSNRVRHSRESRKIVIKTMQHSRFEPTDEIPQTTIAKPDQPATIANLVALDQGLYALEIGESRCMRGLASGLRLPMVQVSAPCEDQDRSAEIIGTSGRGGTWLGQAGGTVIVKSPPGGAHVLITVYGLSAQ